MVSKLIYGHSVNACCFLPNFSLMKRNKMVSLNGLLLRQTLTVQPLAGTHCGEQASTHRGLPSSSSSALGLK